MHEKGLVGQSGFTLVELLVVIGIIGVLIGILIPVLNRARMAAKSTHCCNQLRQLAAASTIYLNDHKRYPAPLHIPALGAAFPTSMQAGVMNEMARIYRWPSITPTTTVPDLPQGLVCPFRQEVPLFQSPDLSFGLPLWITGYGYFGRLDEPPNRGQVLKPERVARSRGGRRGVLWADTLSFITTGGGPQGYSYFHYAGSLKFEPVFGVLQNSDACLGQHRAWSDGGVEWVSRGQLQLDRAWAEKQASYKVVVPGLGTMYFYF